MIFIAYILIILAALAMVYFGHMQGTSQFYMSVFSAAIVCYCVYLDFKKRQEKKAEEQRKSTKGSRSTSNTSKSGKTKDTANISKIARQSTKDKDLKK